VSFRNWRQAQQCEGQKWGGAGKWEAPKRGWRGGAGDSGARGEGGKEGSRGEAWGQGAGTDRFLREAAGRKKNDRGALSVAGAAELQRGRGSERRSAMALAPFGRW